MTFCKMHFLTTVLLLTTCLTCWSQERRKIIIDQDAAGPGGTDQQSMLLLIQSPKTEVLGITVVTGDQWLIPKWRTHCACWNLSGGPTFRLCREPSIRW